MEPFFKILFETKSQKILIFFLDVDSDEFYMYAKKLKYYVFCSM
jgi:hypothetical protein